MIGETLAPAKIQSCYLSGSTEREADGNELAKSSTLKSLLRQSGKMSGFGSGLDVGEEHGVKQRTGAGLGLVRVTSFGSGQADMRRCVPFLSNRTNAI